ncbi:MAG: 1,4-alpha-glucan-branching enzyme, partial [Bacteroidales bacterium]|nr:1,4-alpha-glucan-branching enzyme [Bacteroidales bacterium]
MIFKSDPYLEPYKDKILARQQRIIGTCNEISGSKGCLTDIANGHLWYGVHHKDGKYYFREWAPNANKIYLIGDMNSWRKQEHYALKPIGNGNWELVIPDNEAYHGDLFKWYVEWPGGGGERLPAYARRCV